MITLVLGGVRSGKSEVAERLAGPGPGTYLATGLVDPDDADFADRVAHHRARRPASWATVEEPRAVPGVLARLHGVVLLDALGPWIANDPRADVDSLVEALVSRRGDTVVVSEEVGLGVHPMTEVGRLFADRLGTVNRRIAEVADRCLLVVAGRVIELPAGSPAFDLSPTSWTGPLPPDAGELPQPVALKSHSRPWTRPDRDRSRQAAGGGLRQALAFLTPVGGAAAASPAALAWFPVVGAVLGLVLGGLWWGAEDRLGALLAAALVVTADLALTGALHFDGLLDSADGLLPHLRRERRLAVMADPHVGAFAVATGAGALLLRTAALATLGAARPLLLAALWSLARTAMAVTAMTGRYARAHGLASSFLSNSDPAAPTSGSPGAGVAPPAVATRPTGTSHPTAATPQEGGTSQPGGDRRGAGATSSVPPWAVPAGVGAVLALGLAASDGAGSVLAVAAAGLAAAAMAAFANRRIDGFTGDTLGAAGVLSETIGLLAAAAVLRP